MKKILVILGLCLGLFGLSPLVAASEKDQAVALVNEAAKAVTAGRDAGLQAIQAGKFVKGEIYVFAYDMNAVMLAHPKNPKLVGQNMMDKPDVEGKLFRREIAEKARSAGTGWVDYVYKNPDTQKVEQKTTYLKRVGDVVLCAGVYR